MNNISISNIVSEAWTLFKEHASSIIVILLVYLVTTASISIIGAAIMGDSIFITFIFQIIQSVIGIILALGFNRILLNIINGQSYEVKTLFSQTNSSLVLHTIIGSVVMSIAIIVGLIFLIIPGLYIAFRLQFFNYALLEQETPNFSDAIKTSWDMTRGHVLNLVGIAIVSVIIVIGGVLALIVGLFVAMPVISLMNVLVYQKLKTKALDTEMPK
ncbi:MAG: hypothetical protein COA49_09925 [Bacteroidetes bacterium]|nr:MAG: hypothetical protein COA49_09925 [Bacteroidota bacterium]